MLFSSTTFLVLFLTGTLLAYYIVPRCFRWGRNLLLLAVSLVSYWWGEPKFVLLMVATAVVAWGGGLLLHRFAGENRPGAKKAVFVITVILLVGSLFVFKYLGFSA